MTPNWRVVVASFLCIVFTFGVPTMVMPVIYGDEVGPAAPGPHQAGAGAYGWSLLRGAATGLGERLKTPPRRVAHAAPRVFLERVGEVPAQQIAAEPWREDPMPAAPGTAQRRQIHRLNGRQRRSDVGHERSSANRRAPSVLAPPPPRPAYRAGPPAGNRLTPEGVEERGCLNKRRGPRCR